MRVAVTGATGFVGRPTVARLCAAGHDVLALLRNDSDLMPPGVQKRVIGPMELLECSAELLRGVDVVVHLAGRVHKARSQGDDALHEAVNARGTAVLAEAAGQAGVKRVISVSSVAVYGEKCLTDERGTALPFKPEDPVNPQGAYARTKVRAETALWALAAKYGFEATVVRPPSVYGPGVGAKFRWLMKAIDLGIPLPLAGIRNLRSWVYVESLADLLGLCVHHPAAPGQTLLVSDGEDVSTPDLARRLGRALGRPTRLIWMPTQMLRGGLRLAGRVDFYAPLCESLMLDASRTRALLGWQPLCSLDEALARTVNPAPTGPG
jgi:nucleoside-diphosphate-sugar epimerase